VHGKGDKWVTFPLRAFESAVLSMLAEVKIDDLQPGTPAVNKVEVLAGRLAEAETLVKKWRAKMDVPDLVDIVAEKLAELEPKRREISTQLADAQREAASPIAEAIGQVRMVGNSLEEDNSDENRLRCRAAIRRAIEDMWCLLLPGRGIRGSVRVAVVQVNFKTGAHRTYLIIARPAMSNGKITRPGSLWVRSFTDSHAPGERDLRKRKDVAAVEKFLDGLPLQTLTANAAEKPMSSTQRQAKRK
jgi:hypothetical protein